MTIANSKRDLDQGQMFAKACDEVWQKVFCSADRAKGHIAFMSSGDRCNAFRTVGEHEVDTFSGHQNLLACLGERYLTILPAPQQRDLQVRFERAQLCRDGRRSEVQTRGCCGQTAGFDNDFQSMKLLQRDCARVHDHPKKYFV